MASKNLSDFEIFVIFDRIWETYKKINDVKEVSARKAFQLACRQGEDPKLIELAVKIYYHESAGEEYHFQFGNFIRDDHWKDFVGDHIDYKSYLSSLEKKEAAALDLLTRWNSGCPNHWCPVADVHSKIPIAKRALSDKAFKENWEIALDKARKIFYKPLHSTDYKSKIILSFRWFTTLGDKHTVMRLIEGEYGHPENQSEVKRPKFISDEELKKTLQETKSLWDEIGPPDI